MPEGIVVEFEDDDDAAHARRIKALNDQADRDRAEAARLRRETAALQREGNMRALESAQLTARSELGAAETAYREAREYGDVDREVEATKRLTAVQTRLSQLEAQAATVQRMPISSGDQFEDHLTRFTGPTAQWMREHRDWVEDPRKNSRLVGAHHVAVAAGMEPDSPEYFAHVERTLKVGGNGGGSVSRGGMSDSGNTVRLTKGELERSEDGSICWNVGNTDRNGNVIRHGDARVGKPIGRHEYARRKQAQIADGLHNKLS
jgi:hypothetical protein